ncbi:MAG: hypothetical protein KGI06_04820 [Candidatus Micrarchaeota archaeon]|nr:hypothetical protein [Candidatus Micrarchaeota archaeon]
MSHGMKFYRISELPSKKIDSNKIFECIGKQNFVLLYDLANSTSMLGFMQKDFEDIGLKMEKFIPGMHMTELEFHKLDGNLDIKAFSIYRKVDRYEDKLFNDVFNLLPTISVLGILFVPIRVEEINYIKKHIEDVLSSKTVRETESSFMVRNKSNSTLQKELYYDSEEKMMLNDTLESLNKSILGNNLVYKIFLIASGDIVDLSRYIKTNFLILEEYNFNKDTIEAVIHQLSNKPSLSFGTDYAKEFMNFHGYYDVNHTLTTSAPKSGNGIRIGKFVKDGVSETDFDINIEPSTINLGFIITGLPGSGKTVEAMSVLDSIISSKATKPTVFVITPTSEWKNFALCHKMHFIKLCDDDTPINFFRHPKTVGSEKFYGNLAMILSAAANSGPYQKPMEKCMLSAFRRVYITNKNYNDTEPDPIKVYDEIEESVTRYHGKRIPSGIKYTKHGENIRSGLENLRGILSKKQYCVKEGIRIEDFIGSGAIFDVSGASSGTRTQLYALILNQIYALTDGLDMEGDNELRLVICLEEAQTIFGDPYSPAVQDIKQRIQDFRKQGIGLILLTHNVNDIEAGIRRLCQIKLYLKQASDIAPIAAKDLIFAYVDNDEVVLKLKTLSSRIGAFSSTSKSGHEKRQQDTIFIKTETYVQENCINPSNLISKYMEKLNINTVEEIKCTIELKRLPDSKELKECTIILRFLGEEIWRALIDKMSGYEICLLKGKDYTIQILDKKGRILKDLRVCGAQHICIYA